MRLVTGLFDQALAPVGLRCTQMTVLMAVATYGPASIRALADTVALDASSLSRALDPLERDGLIVREVGASRRSRDIRITQAGLEKIRQAAPLWAEAEKIFGDILGRENKAAFDDIVNRTQRLKTLDPDALKKQGCEAA